MVVFAFRLAAMLWALALPASAQNAPDQPIHIAALTGNTAAIAAHIAAGSDLDQRDAYGSTPLSLAITFGRSAAAQMLIDAGADPDRPDAQGSTPLHLAAFFARPQAVAALLRAGADATARSPAGASAYDIAAAPVAMDADVYQAVGASLAPLGLTLDMDRIARARPEIAALLRPPPKALTGITYAPWQGGLPVADPAAQGLDAALVAELFFDAQSLPTLYGLLVLKNGHLVAEGYFNGAARTEPRLIQSATKSIVSALVGLAVERGCIDSLDRRLAAFLPELSDTDPAKGRITLRQLLQMRSGLPWEETDPALWAALIEGDTFALIDGIDLVNAPGAAFNYSNLTANLLAVIVSRACDTDLRDFAETHLLGPVGMTVGEWWQDGRGYRYPILELTARGLARFALTYAQGGRFGGHPVVPEAWVTASLTRWSNDAWIVDRQDHAGRYFQTLGYGYQWWNARVGAHDVWFAWGHGGQLAVLVPDQDLILVTTADPFWGQHDATSWRHERAVLNLAGKFISLLPGD